MKRTYRAAIHGGQVGLLGALVLTGADRLEQAMLGRSQIYAPRAIARRLFESRGELARFAGLEGVVLRALYGAGLAALYAVLRPRLPARATTAGLVLGGGIWAFELVALPALRAVPPLRRWPRTELALLLAHTLVFGLTTALTYERRAGLAKA